MQLMEYELWRARQAELLREAENARLARLLRAERPKLANGALAEEFSEERLARVLRAERAELAHGAPSE